MPHLTFIIIGDLINLREGDHAVFKKRKKTFLYAILAICLLILLISLTGCAKPAQTPPPAQQQPQAQPQPQPQPPKEEAPKSIKVGYAISLTGPYSTGANVTQIPNYKLWAKEVNDRGGIYLSKYDQRVPVELIEYDDTSNIETAIRLIEKLTIEDKVDLLLPPWGTAMNFAVAPIINAKGYPVIAPTATDMDWYKIGPNYPYVFSMLNQPDVTMGGLMKFLAAHREEGKIGNKVAVIFVGDKFGIEHAGIITPLLAVNGFELIYYESYPLGVSDLTSVLREIMRKQPDVFIALSYPADTFMIVSQSRTLGFNPPVFYTAVATAFPSFRDNFGADIVEGIMGHGAWNPNVPFEGAKEYFKNHVEVNNKEPDRWASAHAYAALQILEQAVEEVGSIDREKIRDVIATGEFNTIIGTVTFDQFGLNTQFPGVFGQWQGGEFQIMWPPENATAKPLLPKPQWP